MNDRTASEERFTRIEIKAAYLEKLASDLNDVVVQQAQLIEDLVQRLVRLERQLEVAEERELPQERPPHY